MGSDQIKTAKKCLILFILLKYFPMITTKENKVRSIKYSASFLPGITVSLGNHKIADIIPSDDLLVVYRGDLPNVYELLQKMMILGYGKHEQDDNLHITDRKTHGLSDSLVDSVNKNSLLHVLLSLGELDSQENKQSSIQYSKRGDNWEESTGSSLSSNRQDLPQHEGMHGVVDELCVSICTECRRVLSKRWSAFCDSQCYTGGREYDACVVVWKYLQ